VRLITISVLIALLSLSVVTPGNAGPQDDMALGTVLAAYYRLRSDHLAPQDSDTLLRAATLAMHRLLSAVRLPANAVRPADVPDLLRPLDTLILRGQEEADVKAFREHFLWTAYLAHSRVGPMELAHAAIRGMAAAYRDPYTTFMTPAEYHRFQIQTRRAEGSIGASLRFARDGPTIRLISDDGPAARAGLRIGDIIIRIDGRSTASLNEGEVLDALRGAAHTTVSLEIRRPGVAEPLRRAVVRTASNPVRAMFPEQHIGYVKLAHFTEPAIGQALSILADLERRGARAMVLDLRGNGGGSVFAALMVASALLENGNVAISIGRTGKSVAYPVLPLKTRFTGTVVVLVDADTASAAEIVAGSLQDAGVVVIGRPTFGKAIIQNTFVLPDGSAIKLTVARYLTPRGRDLSQKGLIPDIILQDGSDDALQRALEWLRGKTQSARYSAA